MNQINLAQGYKYQKSRLKFLKNIKTSCLVIACTSSFVAISICLFNLNLKTRSKLQLPNQISLANWQFKESKILNISLDNDATSAQQYLYVSSSRNVLRVDAIYTNGTVSISKSLEMIGVKSSNNNLSMRYLDKVGYYALFSDKERAYLSSCINSRGMTTATEEQFINNRPLEMTWSHISAYLMGTSDLFDDRCLFTTISIPIEKNDLGQNSSSLDKKYQTLEKVWINWHLYWKDNFPKE
ncbi:cyanoexosortase A system-associated protein [Pseudanabaena sp. Chao 1811]|uniref:cyanoexosortase A system-associated protein n=1 Tax=Pseudanabaena sp. Chao 1811 TaxID=2963092 RepID=UPI0022F40495|nr:cyanoexosortase A system-associated protein [Pseudanabaena sp. Chao 1811]